MLSVVILISGRGSNMESILAAGLPLKVKAVISNNASAAGLQTARAAGIQTRVVDHRAYPSRELFDEALQHTILELGVDLVVLAGFMRVLTGKFIDAMQGRVINIHPSLLPSFPGLNTHQQALEAGVKIHGATVHFVTVQLDHGPIIAQAAVPVLTDDTAAVLAARVLKQEHVLYPEVLRRIASGELRLPGQASGVLQATVSRVTEDPTLTSGSASLRGPWN
ncbi:MAG: phosphoribosylglycinamide formyltransferase [Aeromicrobium sp.]|nr:phosphoribosylglycinamide formyltransferase [Burkholderiales bacterium]